MGFQDLAKGSVICVKKLQNEYVDRLEIQLSTVNYEMNGTKDNFCEATASKDVGEQVVSNIHSEESGEN